MGAFAFAFASIGVNICFLFCIGKFFGNSTEMPRVEKEHEESSTLELPLYCFNFSNLNVRDRVILVLCPVLSVLGCTALFLFVKGSLIVPTLITASVFFSYAAFLLAVFFKRTGLRKKLNL